MECQVSLLVHDGDCGIYEKDNDDDSNDDEYNNNTLAVEYYEEDEEEDDDDEYYKFDSDNNKRRISRSNALAYLYHVVCKCFQAKGWKHNN